MLSWECAGEPELGKHWTAFWDKAFDNKGLEAGRVEPRLEVAPARLSSCPSVDVHEGVGGRIGAGLYPLGMEFGFGAEGRDRFPRRDSGYEHDRCWRSQFLQGWPPPPNSRQKSALLVVHF